MDRPFASVALAYLRLGKPTIPLCRPDHKVVSESHIEKCEHPGKTPLIKGWQQYGSKLPTVQDIKTWGRQWPNGNIGGPTGPLWGVALDIDPRHGGDTELDARGWRIPDTVTNLTGGGGAHYLFAHPGTHVENQVSIAPGIDIRGDGGQIVLPPSIHESGRVYSWELNGHPAKVSPAPMPVWLTQTLGIGARQPNGAEAQLSLHDTSIMELLTRPIPEGKRNDSLCRIAGLLRLYLKPPMVDAILQAVNEARCTPPLEPSEVSGIVDSVIRYPQPGVNGHPKAVVPHIEWVTP